jgi:hypothetical protein
MFEPNTPERHSFENWVGDIPDNLKLLNMEPKSNRQIPMNAFAMPKRTSKITVEMVNIKETRCVTTTLARKSRR